MVADFLHVRNFKNCSQCLVLIDGRFTIRWFV